MRGSIHCQNPECGVLLHDPPHRIIGGRVQAQCPMCEVEFFVDSTVASAVIGPTDIAAGELL